MYIVLDTETGGLNPRENTLLSLYAGIYDEGGIVDSRYWEITPQKGYTTTFAALAINKLDLADLENNGYPTIEVTEGLHTFIKEHSYKGKLTPLGWNITFDLGFIWEHIIPKYEWDLHISHRFIDVMGLSRFWWNMGSLEKTCESQGIIMAAHNAAEDANATWKVYKKLESIRDACKFALH